MAKSDLEEQFLHVLGDRCAYHNVWLPMPVREFQFHPVRRWRFDFAWVDRKVAVEIDGGTWIGGGHSTGIGKRNDAEKGNAAAAAGWKVLRFTPDMLRDPDDVFEQFADVYGAFDDGAYTDE